MNSIRAVKKMMVSIFLYVTPMEVYEHNFAAHELFSNIYVLYLFQVKMVNRLIVGL